MTREYLELRSWSVRLWWFYTAIIFVCLTAALVAASGTQLRSIQAINDVIITVTSVTGICASLYGMIRKKTVYASSFLLGLGTYTAGGLLWTKQFTGVIPSTWWSVHVLFIGQILQNIVFSYAVVRQLRNKMVVTTLSREASRYGERMGHLVRVLTHDLSNYISIIDGSSMILAREDVDIEAGKRQIAKMRKALHQQREVLDSIKELKALEDGKAALRLEKVDVGLMLGDLNATFDVRLAQKVVKIEMSGVMPGEIYVLADRKTLFHSVICNLISNAINFSDALGVIKVDVRAGEDIVEISVTDSGIGMPEDLLARMFMNSEKTSRLGTGGEVGAGFGLPICKAYMDVYGGTISVASRTKERYPLDHGTNFTLTFKRAR
jgi:signal transduction histidine kinase